MAAQGNNLELFCLHFQIQSNLWVKNLSFIENKYLNDFPKHVFNEEKMDQSLKAQ